MKKEIPHRSITYRSVWKNTNTEIENTDSLWFAMNDDDSHLSKHTSFSHLFWEFIDVSVYFFKNMLLTFDTAKYT
jgi:hypothetical protein